MASMRERVSFPGILRGGRTRGELYGKGNEGELAG
jgi:hypothetical protein